ncbi:Asparagine-rich protein (ARP protein) [Hypoxylon texense]
MRYKGNDRPRAPADAKLPPLEAFSFKSIMADIQQDVGADLDRIAEICARSKYSLSNQYEVHIAPQGSGSGFVGPSAVSSSSRPSLPMGPTLQAISSDDEQTGPVQKKRRSIARRRSVAYGTLETIMSSSRSSDEDKCRKKPAAEIVEEVRGRAAENDNTEEASEDSTEAQASSEQHEQHELHELQRDRRESNRDRRKYIFAAHVWSDFARWSREAADVTKSPTNQDIA